MIKAMISGSDRSLAMALSEFGEQAGVKIISENVVVPNELCCETVNFYGAFNLATLAACAAIDRVPAGDVFVGRQSVLLRNDRSWRHLISVQIVDRFQTLLCGTWTATVSVPRNLADMVRSRGTSASNLEAVLTDLYGQEDVDPYCRLSGGRTRQQLFVEALLKVPNRRWLTRF